MTRKQEEAVLLCRFRWQEFLSAAKEAGFTVTSASFEERERQDREHPETVVEVFGHIALPAE